ncbi:MAG: Organic solvent tolerance protein OstA [Cyclobacteriaceae bacterium]|nr:Organic solvent tolerance protein OstA [Cyclobacteriaceae bacterium]
MMRSVLVLLLVFSSGMALAQRQVKLKKADNLFGAMKDGERFDRVIGNVIFIQNNTTIYCDSAHFFKKQNRIEAFGQVHITDGDSVDVVSRSLSYDGNKRIAYLRKNVVFTKKGIATLYTDFLDYDRPKSEARYFNGGRLVDSANVLTSKKGYYDIRSNMASFKTEVVGKNPDYTMESDTLQYNSTTKIIYFRDHTTVTDKDGSTAIYKSGYYNTGLKASTLNLGQMETAEYKIKGDEYRIDEARKHYRAKGRVVMTSKEENMLIFGDDSFYDKQRGISKVYGNAFVAKVGEDADTLFIAADTLVSIESQDPHKKRLLAYHNVKIYKTDMQGLADSLAYIAIDSTVHMYTQPILWNSENQMTADSIYMVLRNKKIDRLYMITNSFVASQDSLKNFNQIKGRKMVAHFRGSQIGFVTVDGNGESIYHALQEKEVDTDKGKFLVTYTTGMNKMICSNMRINFLEGRVNNVSAYVQPDATFTPPHEIKEADRLLKGFNWKGDLRPLRQDVVKRSPNEANP